MGIRSNDFFTSSAVLPAPTNNTGIYNIPNVLSTLCVINLNKVTRTIIEM